MMVAIFTVGAVGFGMFSAGTFELTGEAKSNITGMRMMGFAYGSIALAFAYTAGAMS